MRLKSSLLLPLALTAACDSAHETVVFNPNVDSLERYIELRVARVIECEEVRVGTYSPEQSGALKFGDREVKNCYFETDRTALLSREFSGWEAFKTLYEEAMENSEPLLIEGVISIRGEALCPFNTDGDLVTEWRSVQLMYNRRYQQFLTETVDPSGVPVWERYGRRYVDFPEPDFRSVSQVQYQFDNLEKTLEDMPETVTLNRDCEPVYPAGFEILETVE